MTTTKTNGEVVGTQTATDVPSWKPRYATPPPVKRPYKVDEALDDLPGVSYALELFLASHMVESEEYCHTSDKPKERLYFATGYGLIQCVKGLMSYADVDLLAGIGHTKHGNHIASQHRKKASFFGLVASTLGASGVNFVKSMTPVERHAELVYAESLFEKALLGIVYSGDWLAFIKEALNMRTTISVYRQLGAFLDDADAAWAEAHSSPSDSASSLDTTTSSSRALQDPTIDVHFRSGVYLGVGMCNIILSLMPGKLATLVELFGYKGDRKLGLELLMKAGGWVEGQHEPLIGTAEEGVRRSICDMCLLIFHLVLSSFTFDGVDISVAQKVLDWNLKRYPNGVFFLFGAGRLALVRSQPRRAIAYYTQAMRSQTQYRNLHHVSFWEIAIAGLALWELGPEEAKAVQDSNKAMVNGEEDKTEVNRKSIEVKVEEKAKDTKGETGWVGGSLDAWRELEKEATWSKSIYSYGMAVCLLEIANGHGHRGGEVTAEKEKERKEMKKEAAKLMGRVPGLRQKIAGKSIPLEKFVARKARKFASQGGRLILPALEVAYLFQAIAHAPRSVITTKMLPEVRAVLAKLGEYDASGRPLTGGARDENDKKDKSTYKPKGAAKYEGGKEEYWDDLCLARFLEGVCLRYIAYPDPDAVLDPDEVVGMAKDEAEEGSEAAFRAVLEHGPKIELDHHLVYHAHYELGRLLACQGKTEEARVEFELVISGKYLEVGPSGRKGKYSMENALHMRTHAAVEALHQKRL